MNKQTIITILLALVAILSVLTSAMRRISHTLPKV